MRRPLFCCDSFSLKCDFPDLFPDFGKAGKQLGKTARFFLFCYLYLQIQAMIQENP